MTLMAWCSWKNIQSLDPSSALCALDHYSSVEVKLFLCVCSKTLLEFQLIQSSEMVKCSPVIDWHSTPRLMDPQHFWSTRPNFCVSLLGTFVNWTLSLLVKKIFLHCYNMCFFTKGWHYNNILKLKLLLFTIWIFGNYLPLTIPYSVA